MARCGESARLPPMCPGFGSRIRRHMWVEFVVGSLPCSEKFFSGYYGFPLSSKTSISKFQFDLDYCQALYHEPLARVIARTSFKVGETRLLPRVQLRAQEQAFN